ncbi:MAG: hypothetical protein Q9214_006750 [Letrouitia sp. 1 TL-2023]
MLPSSGVKLRDSCESCAASKVRCSREKPTCNRCAERGADCQYAVKQRTGRKFRRRDSINDSCEDATSSQTVTPVSSTSPFFPELDMLFDSSLGALGASTNLPMGFDGFKAPPSTTDFLSLPVTPDQNLLNQPSICSDHAQRYAVGNRSLNKADIPFQSCEGFLSESNKTGLNGEELGLVSSTCSFPTVQLAPQPGAARNVIGSQQPDSLETALRLMRQLSCGEDHSLLTSLTATGHDHHATEPPQLQIVIDKNKKAMEAVRSTLQTMQSTYSQDGYILVVVCLIVSKVLSKYASAVRVACARENGRRRSSASAPSTLSENKDPIAPQRVLDELYQVQASMNQLGAKMQLWAKRNRTSGSEAFPIGNDTSHTILAGFPFSATVLNQLYTELRKRLSILSLEMIDELKRYWT